MAGASDKRYRFLERWATLLLKVQPDEWRELMDNQEAVAMLDEFFKQPDVRRLVLGRNSAGQLLPTTCFPPAHRGKVVCFAKKKCETITQENYQSVLMVRDISPSPVEQLITVVQEVVCPLLLKEENTAGWPSVVVEDVVRQTQQLKREMVVMSGKLQGKPLLPLPEDSSGSLQDWLAGPVNASVLRTTETLVMEWSDQIRDILSKDLAQPLLDGLHPLPRTEFEFWHTRMVNLQCINDQLLLPRVTALAKVLEKANSCYWPLLQSLLRDISAGLEEAKDVDLHLQPLRILLEEMEQTEYSQLQPCVHRVLCTVRLLRAHCQHYRSPAHIIVILQEICNLLVEMTRNFLGPKDVMKGLQGETKEILEGIRLSISTVENLFQSYSTYCSDSTPALFPEEPELWKFPPSLAFWRAESFLYKLKTIEELYQTTIEFRKLEKAEMGGLKGSMLGSRMFEICEEVSELAKSFADCKYDPLDPAEERWDKDFAEFQKKMQDVDRRLATIFRLGFEDCNCLASALKLAHAFASTLERPLIKAEVSPCYSVLLGLFKAEVENVKVLYDAQVTSPLPAINKNTPPVAGQLKWALGLQQRLEGLHRDLFAIDHSVMATAEAKVLSEQYKEIMGLLQGYCGKVYEEWVQGAGQNCHFNLEQPLVLRDPSVSFSKELVAVLREVKYMKFQHQEDIPGSAESLFAQNPSCQGEKPNSPT